MITAPGMSMCQIYPAYTSGAPEDVSTALHGSGEGSLCTKVHAAPAPPCRCTRGSAHGFEHVPDLSGLHLRCAGGRLYSPTRIRRRLVVYPGACVMRVAPVWTHTGTVQHAPFNADAGPRLAVHQQAARQYARGHRRRSSEHGWATHMSSLVHGPALRDGGLQVKNRPSANDCSVRCRNIAKK